MHTICLSISALTVRNVYFPGSWSSCSASTSRSMNIPSSARTSTTTAARYGSSDAASTSASEATSSALGSSHQALGIGAIVGISVGVLIVVVAAMACLVVTLYKRGWCQCLSRPRSRWTSRATATVKRSEYPNCDGQMPNVSLTIALFRLSIQPCLRSRTLVARPRYPLDSPETVGARSRRRQGRKKR